MTRTLFIASFLLSMAAWSQEASELTGKWSFVLETEDGSRQAEATFVLDGTTVTGKWDQADVKGTFTGGKLDLSFPLQSAEAGYTANLQITGMLEHGELTGRWQFGEHSGTYRAHKKV
jgi:hypothetical protein